MSISGNALSFAGRSWHADRRPQGLPLDHDAFAFAHPPWSRALFHRGIQTHGESAFGHPALLACVFLNRWAERNEIRADGRAAGHRDDGPRAHAGEVQAAGTDLHGRDVSLENLRDLAGLGILGMAVPEDYGGLGLPVLDTALVLEEIAKGCYVTAMAVLGEVGVQTKIIAAFAPDSIRRRILPAVVSGEMILAICMTEPHAGTDVANYRTNVDVQANRLVLKGSKTLISRVDEAGTFVVFTRINRQPGREGIGCVLIEKGTPGFEVTARYHTMGGENLAELSFDNCELPLENLILERDGFRQLLSAFNTQRCLNPAISLGLAEGAFEESVRYMRDRTAFGRPIGEFQGMRWKLAEMYRDIEVGRSILYRACATADPFPDPLLAAAAKVTVNEMAL